MSAFGADTAMSFSNAGSSPKESAFERLCRRVYEHTGVEPRGRGDQRMAICPAHDDSTASLSIGRKPDRAVMECKALCKTEDILAILKMTMPDLFDEPLPARERPRVVAEYQYRNERGELQYTIKRLEPGPGGKKKVFYPYLPGASRSGLGNVERILYRLPEVVAGVRGGATVYIAEGEKDCDTLVRLGCIATTNPGGAGRWHAHYANYFIGAHVVVIADRDKEGQGREHARAIVDSLHGKAASVLVVEAAVGKDVTDHIQAGRTLEELRPVDLDEETAPTVEPPTPEAEEPERRTSRIDWATLFATDFSDIDWLPGKLMARGQQVALVGDGKAGKSLFAQEWAWRMAAGLAFLGDIARDQVSVLYLDRENGHEDLFDRLRSFGATPATLANLHYESFPAIPPLDGPGGGAAVMALVEETGAQVVFIDTISRFISGKENDSDTWLDLYRCTLALLKARGISSVRLDHFGKDRERGSRGSSAKTQDVDHIWELTGLERGGNRLKLQRTHTRTGIGDDNLMILRLAERVGDKWKPGATRHVIPDGTLLDPVQKLVRQLDIAGIPNDYGRDKVRNTCAERKIPLPSNAVLSEVVKVRKARLNLSRDLGDSPEMQTCPNCQDSFPVSAGHSCPGQLWDTSGQSEAVPVPVSPPLRGGQDGPTRPTPHPSSEPFHSLGGNR